MSGWRDETRGDLGDARERLSAAMASVSGEPTEEQVRSIWRAYLDIEKSVVFIKVELDEENPGRFLKVSDYSVPDERQALKFALMNLEKGMRSFEVGDLRQTLGELREARNYLRALLRAKRKRAADDETA